MSAVGQKQTSPDPDLTSASLLRADTFLSGASAVANTRGLPAAARFALSADRHVVRISVAAYGNPMVRDRPAKETPAAVSCEAICISFPWCANRTAPMPRPARNMMVSPTAIMPLFRGGSLTPHNCLSKSFWSRRSIFKVFQKGRDENARERIGVPVSCATFSTVN
jgi:hypothetical protein